METEGFRRRPSIQQSGVVQAPRTSMGTGWLTRKDWGHHRGIDEEGENIAGDNPA